MVGAFLAVHQIVIRMKPCVATIRRTGFAVSSSDSPGSQINYVRHIIILIIVIVYNQRARYLEVVPRGISISAPTHEHHPRHNTRGTQQ